MKTSEQFKRLIKSIDELSKVYELINEKNVSARNAIKLQIDELAKIAEELRKTCFLVEKL